MRFVDVTVAVGDTRVDLLVLNRPLEEAFAGLAREKAVVISGHFVAAHRTQFFDALLGVRLVVRLMAVLDEPLRAGQGQGQPRLVTRSGAGGCCRNKAATVVNMVGHAGHHFGQDRTLLSLGQPGAQGSPRGRVAAGLGLCRELRGTIAPAIRL